MVKGVATEFLNNNFGKLIVVGYRQRIAVEPGNNFISRLIHFRNQAVCIAYTKETAT